MNQFDELARRAAESARFSVSQLAVPPSPRGSATHRSVRGGLMLAAVATVVIGLIVVANRGSTPVDVSGTPSSTSAGSSADAPGPYFEFEVPKGWVLAVTPEPSRPTGVVAVNAGLAYGAGTPDHPFADSDLSISISSISPYLYLPPDQSHEVVIRGHLGETSFGGEGFNTITWQESDRLALSISSKRYSIEAMTKIADSLIVDGLSVTLPAPPDGMSLVTSRGITQPRTDQSSDMWTMAIADPESEARIILRAMEPQTGLLDFMKFTRSDLVDVDVRGTTGVLDRTLSGDGTQEAGSIYWIEDGQAMWLLSIGSGDPIAIANSLRRIDKSRFDELVTVYPMPLPSLTTVAPKPSTPPPTTTAP